MKLNTGKIQMRKCIRFTVEEALPARQEVLDNQGMRDPDKVPKRIVAALDSALELYPKLADPQGIMDEVSLPDFKVIFDGNGLNSQGIPLESIFPQAERLALFATTAGNSLSAEISNLFAKKEPLLAYMLDAVTSVGCDLLAVLMAQHYEDFLKAESGGNSDLRVLAYSPGHCGWHISSQEQLFQFLHPDEIGVTLSPAGVMKPIKSLSGVLAGGKKEIHQFTPNFPFCDLCKKHYCLRRM